MDVQKMNEEAVGAPGTIEIGGKTYLASQLSKPDFITLNKHLRAIHKKRTLSPLQALAAKISELPPAMQERAIKHAMDAEGRSGGRAAEPETADIAPIIYEPEGAAACAWLSIRKLQPHVTLEELAQHITPDTVDDVLATLMTATGLEAMKGKDGKNLNGATGS